MIVYTSYKVKLHAKGIALEDTIRCYRHALKWYLKTVSSLWEDISLLSSVKKRLNYLEKQTVKTRNNSNPPHPYIGLYPNVPCYLRRAAAADALGLVTSYQSLRTNWLMEKEDAEEPEFPKVDNAFPSLYKGNMYLRTGMYSVKIKVYKDKQWTWLESGLRKSDVDYILHHCQEKKECSPLLRKKGKEWFLDFPFEESVTLAEDLGTKVLGVDLGINSAAVCSTIDNRGKITDRAFLKLAKEESRLKKRVGKVKRYQQNGNYTVIKPWVFVNKTNNDMSEKTAQFIVQKALENKVHVIVMEDLKKIQGRTKGPMVQRLALWRRRVIYRKVLDKAHRKGIHVSLIDPRGTSKHAFDGSGIVQRDSNNYAIASFQSGKVYNADLNASYNIGARFWIREIEKSIPQKEWLAVKAKVPSLSRRSTHTLSTLVDLNAYIGST